MKQREPDIDADRQSAGVTEFCLEDFYAEVMKLTKRERIEFVIRILGSVENELQDE